MPTQDYYEKYNHLFKWLAIREKHGLEFPGSLQQLQISMMKSSLFSRLTEGKDPLPYPPPLNFSYPWYSLIENGEATITDLWTDDNMMFSSEDPILVINQFPWIILNEIDEDSWLVTYEYTLFSQRITADGVWHVYKDSNSWIIKKLNG